MHITFKIFVIFIPTEIVSYSCEKNDLIINKTENIIRSTLFKVVISVCFLDDCNVCRIYHIYNNTSLLSRQQLTILVLILNLKCTINNTHPAGKPREHIIKLNDKRDESNFSIVIFPFFYQQHFILQAMACMSLNSCDLLDPVLLQSTTAHHASLENLYRVIFIVSTYIQCLTLVTCSRHSE